MRGVSLAVLLVLAVATVLGVSWRNLQKERDRLRQGFVAARDADVGELASDLDDRLTDLEQDARVIETLVDRAYDVSGPDREDRTRTLRASFNAMATVIRHYRTLVLLSPGTSRPLVVAVDPGEAGPTATALVQMSCAVGPDGARVHGLTGPAQLPGGRVFYFYSFQAGGNDVVISIEAPLLLQAAFPSLPSSRIVVTDPRGVEWVRSGAAAAPFTLRGPDARAGVEADWSGSSGSAWLASAEAQELGLPAGSAVAVWASANPAGLGPWRVLLLRSARELEVREATLVRQVILTAAGLLLAIGVLGSLIVRQQRYSAALTERLRSAETLRSLERQLIRAEKLATTGVLAAGIAHEVGTPLGIIRARAELLLDEIDRPQSRRALEAIVEQIDRISSIIRQVLDFSRAQPVELGRVDVATAVPQVLELLGHRLRQHGIAAGVDVPAGLPPLAADPNQFQQVLINLLLNACDACAGGGRIEVSAWAAPGAKRVRVDVRDNGAGIASEHLLAVFDPFFTTKKRGEGTGLGLPIAASIVRNHGGEITLTSAPGEGTTVTILWPAAAEEARG
jgi:signal transduction histidine kinase